MVVAIFCKPNLSQLWTFTIHKAHFSIGLILNAAFSFVLVAAPIYFIVGIPVNKLRSRNKAEAATGPLEVELLTEIRDSLRSRG